MKEKAVLYLRGSNTSQTPELQKNACINFCKENNLEVVKIFIERKSAYKKDVERQEWIKCEKLAIKEKYSLVVFRYDRTWRNEKEFVKFMKEMYMVYDLKVFSVSENYLNEIWNIIPLAENIPAPFNIFMKKIMEAVWEVVVAITGRKAEEESAKKSNSIKSAIVKKKGKTTKSKYGNKWGKRGLPKQTRDKIIALREKGLSIREISRSVQYTNKHKNMVYVSKSAVHETLLKFSQEKSSNLSCP